MKHVIATTAVLGVLAFTPLSSMAGEDHAMQGMGGAGKMQAHHEKMMQQMERIRATRDPEERSRLIDEHMKSMHEAMQSMRAMKGKSGGSMEERMRSMEKRMDMMQTMMEQMMENRMEQRKTQKRHDHRKTK